MKCDEVIRQIEKTAPLEIAAAWDHSGIQVPSRRAEITGLGVCLEPTPQSIRQAVEGGADMVLAHHPLSLEPRFPDRLDAYHEVLSLLFRENICLYSAHTSLDANPRGPVSWLLEALELQCCPDAMVLEPTATFPGEGGYACGFGFIGSLKQPWTREEFTQSLEPYFRGVCARLVGKLPERICKIAVCPGSGTSLAEAAAQAGADVLITGDAKYHPALEFPLPVLDVGHFCLEEKMMQYFSLRLQTALPDIKVFFIPGQDPFQPFFCNA